MPTENRSSNTEMVSVPRVPTDEMIVAFAEAWYSKRQTIDDPDMLDAYAAMLAVAPAQQHQGEPVAYRQRFICPDEGPSSWVLTDSNVLDGRPGWEVVPLYTHADPAEVERLREGISKHWEVVCDQRAELDKLRAQLATCTDARETLSAQLRAAHTKLAERDALLREIASIPGDSINYHATHMSRIARAALSASAEPSAPVECDERADFERHVILTTGRPIDSELKRHPVRHDEYECRTMQTRWNDWQARAALDRKPS
ncbi:hypothetical protein [Pseudomonas asiatica]|uniref:hypothetical protein n=1 Tax=Pseudomonas asiatica TaxID=2219225 RepID=UPI0025A385D4|nr:hypothetical protein [Pseudomonas asiatica]WJN52069.1 hypothetical protein QUR91_09825 [Pseudomonas asiatica]